MLSKLRVINTLLKKSGLHVENLKFYEQKFTVIRKRSKNQDDEYLFYLNWIILTTSVQFVKNYKIMDKVIIIKNTKQIQVPTSTMYAAQEVYYDLR